MRADRSKVGTVLMIGGVILLLLAALLICYNLRENQRAGQASAEILQELEQETPSDTPEGEGDLPLYLTTPEMEMPTVMVEGDAYIGRIDVPALGLSLPVMSEWNYDNLKIAPCRYTGSAYQGNLVIAGHNYRSHFGPLKNLSVGAQILFTDTDGNVFQYQVAALEQLGPFETKAMTDSGYPLTLFTCTLGGSYRLAVRCIEKT